MKNKGAKNMSKTSKSKSVTMLGGKNVAATHPPRQKPPKADTTEPKEKKPTPDPEPEKSEQ